MLPTQEIPGGTGLATTGSRKHCEFMLSLSASVAGNASAAAVAGFGSGDGSDVSTSAEGNVRRQPAVFGSDSGSRVSFDALLCGTNLGFRFQWWISILEGTEPALAERD